MTDAAVVFAPLTRGRRGGRGDVSESHRAWVAYNAAADVPTPVVHDGRIYVCGDRGDVSCLDLESGEQIWSERLPRNRYVYSSSPVIADERLYATREDGTTFVLTLGDKPELVATNVLRENTYATPVFVNRQVFLRTSEYLFCIENK